MIVELGYELMGRSNQIWTSKQGENSVPGENLWSL